jgi:hypothetical protein
VNGDPRWLGFWLWVLLLALIGLVVALVFLW